MMSRKLTIILFLLSITSWALLKQESLLVPAPIQACTWVVTSCGAGCADNKDLYNCSQTVQIQAVVSSESNVDSNAKAQYVAPPTVKQYVPPPPPASAQASAAYDPTKIVSTAAVETIKNTPGYSVNPNTTTIDATGKGGNVEEAIGQTATKVKETPPVIKADTSLSISVVNPKGKGEGENCKSGNDCLSGSCEKKLAVSDLDPTTGERIKIFRSFCTAPSMTRTCWYRTQISDEWTCQSTTRESLTRCSDIGMLSTKVGCEAVNNVLFGQTKCWQIINNSCQETTLNGTCYSNNAFTAPGLCEVKLLEIQQNRQESAQRQEQIESQRAVEEHRMVEAILQNEAQKAVQGERDNEQAASDAKRLEAYATSQQTYTDNLQNRTKTCYDKANNCQSASKVLRKTTDTCESVGSYTHQKQCQNPGISGPEEQEIFTKKCYEQSPDCREITRVFNSPTATCEEDGLFSSPDQCETPGSVGYSECSEAPDGQKQTLDISGSISQVCLDPDGCYCAPGNKNIVCSEKCTSYISEVSDFGDQGVVSKVTQKCSGDQFGECEEGEVCTLQSKPGEGTIYFCKGEEIEPTEELVSRQDKPIDQTTKKSAASSITGLLKGLINKSKTETEKIISNIFQLEQSLEACPSSRLLFPSIQGGVACTDSDNKVQFYCYKGDIAHMADGTIHCLYNPNGSIHNYVAPLETPKVAPVEPSVPPDEFGGVGEVTALKCSGDQFGECEDDRQCKGSHTPDGDITYSCQKSDVGLSDDGTTEGQVEQTKLSPLPTCPEGYFSTDPVDKSQSCKIEADGKLLKLGYYCPGSGNIYLTADGGRSCEEEDSGNIQQQNVGKTTQALGKAAESSDTSITRRLRDIVRESKSAVEDINSSIVKFGKLLEDCPKSTKLYTSIQGGIACKANDDSEAAQILFYCRPGGIVNLIDGTKYCFYNPDGSVHRYVAPLEIQESQPSAPPDKFGGVGEAEAIEAAEIEDCIINKYEYFETPGVDGAVACKFEGFDQEIIRYYCPENSIRRTVTSDKCETDEEYTERTGFQVSHSDGTDVFDTATGAVVSIVKGAWNAPLMPGAAIRAGQVGIKGGGVVTALGTYVTGTQQNFEIRKQALQLAFSGELSATERAGAATIFFMPSIGEAAIACTDGVSWNCVGAYANTVLETTDVVIAGSGFLRSLSRPIITLHNSDNRALTSIYDELPISVHNFDEDDIITIYKGIPASVLGDNITPNCVRHGTCKDLAQSIQKYISYGGTLEDYAWRHAVNSSYGDLATSWTTDKDVARYFAQLERDGGVVIEMQIRAGEGISVPKVAKQIGEWPSMGSQYESEIVLFDIVPSSRYSLSD